MQNVNNSTAKVASDELADQVTGLKELNILVEEFADLAVKTLEKAPDRLFIAEQLYCMHTVLAKKLEQLFESADDEDLKLHIALILYRNNNETRFKSFLLEQLTHHEWTKAAPALHKLIQTNTAEAAPAMIEILRHTPLSEMDKIIMLADGLHKFGVKIPPDIAARLTAADVPWQIKAVIK